MPAPKALVKLLKRNYICIETSILMWICLKSTLWMQLGTFSNVHVGCQTPLPPPSPDNLFLLPTVIIHIF